MDADPYCWRDNMSQWLLFFVFDIVYLDDDRSEEIIAAAIVEAAAEGYDCAAGLNPAVRGDITHLPLIVRRKVLGQVFSPFSRVVELVDHRVVAPGVTDKRERLLRIESFFDEVRHVLKLHAYRSIAYSPVLLSNEY